MFLHCSSFSLQCVVVNYETYIESLICVNVILRALNDTCMNKLKDLLLENITFGRVSFSSLKLKQYRKCKDHAKIYCDRKTQDKSILLFLLISGLMLLKLL